MTNATPAVVPTRRNALTTWLFPTVFFLLAPPLGALLGTTAFRFAPNAAILVGLLLTLVAARAMIAELNVAAGSNLTFWHFVIPIYGLYWAAVLVPQAMAVAKQRANKPAPRSAVVYLFLFLYALASDLNDLAV